MKTNKLVLVDWISPEIVQVWLNRPDARNAYSKEFLALLIKTLLDLKKHKTVKICLLRAHGEDFCAGGDIKSMLNQSDLFQGPSSHLEKTYKKYIQRLSLTLDKVNYLTIALVNGAAIGAGVGLSLACDLVWSLENGYFKLPFFNLALVPADGSYWRLARKVGQSRALDMLLRGSKISAHEAKEQGIVDLIVKEDQLKGNLQNLKINLFEKNDWSKIVLSLRETRNVSLEVHLKHMRKLQAKLQLKKSHSQAIKAILK